MHMKVLISALVLALAAWPESGASPQEGCSPQFKRELMPGEIKGSRNPVEDGLRRDILSRFELSDKRLKRIRAYLNAPWDDRSIGFLVSLLVNSIIDDRITITPGQWEAVANMLAYLAKCNEGKAVEAGMADTYELLYAKAEEIDRRRVKSGYFNCTVDAVGRYGTERLLTDAFWKRVEKGYWGGRAIEAVATVRTRDRLSLIYIANPWPADSRMREYYGETLFLVGMQIKHPELRDIKRRSLKQAVAKRLSELALSTPGDVDRIPTLMDGDETRDVLRAIHERLKKEQGRD
jgi:hypothetical protein